MNPNNNWVEVNTPFYNRQRDIRIGDWFVNPSAIALTVTGIVAAILVVHGFGMKVAKRTPGGPEYEKVRVWDAKHPDQSIGQYDPADMAEAIQQLDRKGRETKEDDAYVRDHLIEIELAQEKRDDQGSTATHGSAEDQETSEGQDSRRNGKGE